MGFLVQSVLGHTRQASDLLISHLPESCTARFCGSGPWGFKSGSGCGTVTATVNRTRLTDLRDLHFGSEPPAVLLILAALRPAHPRHGVTPGDCLREAGGYPPASAGPASAGIHWVSRGRFPCRRAHPGGSDWDACGLASACIPRVSVAPLFAAGHSCVLRVSSSQSNIRCSRRERAIGSQCMSAPSALVNGTSTLGPGRAS
jgi:hypothetical protein